MKIREVTRTNLPEATAAPVAQAAGKGVGRFIPGVGAALGAYDAYNRAKQGDWTGAGLSALGGAASLIPGVGTAASLGIAGAQALRDKSRTGSYFPDEEEQAAAVAKDKTAQATPAATTAQPVAATQTKGDPKIFALQQQLIAKGAKIKADGIMGPQTQTAMKQFPDVKLAESIKENKMTEAEKIAALRERLTQLESQQQVDEIGGLASKLGSMFSKFKTGVSNPRSTNLPSGKNLPQQTGAAIARNPGKVAAGSALAGAGTMAALSGGSGTKPAEPAKPAKPAAPARPPAPAPAPAAAPAAAAAASALSAQDEQDLALLAADLMKLRGQNSELDALLDRHLKLRPDAGKIPEPE